MPRYKLRTLLLLLAVLPPLLWFGWMKYEAWRTEKSRREEERRAFRVYLAALEAAAPAKIQALVAAKMAEPQAQAAARREEKEARVQEQMEEARIQTAQRSGGASLLTSTAAEALRRILLALEESLEKLRQQDAMMSPLISLRYCGGLTIEQAAEVLKSSRVTAFRL